MFPWQKGMFNSFQVLKWGYSNLTKGPKKDPQEHDVEIFLQLLAFETLQITILLPTRIMYESFCFLKVKKPLSPYNCNDHSTHAHIIYCAMALEWGGGIVFHKNMRHNPCFLLFV